MKLNSNELKKITETFNNSHRKIAHDVRFFSEPLKATRDPQISIDAEVNAILAQILVTLNAIVSDKDDIMSQIPGMNELLSSGETELPKHITDIRSNVETLCKALPKDEKSSSNPYQELLDCLSQLENNIKQTKSHHK